MRVATVQFDPQFGKIDENIAKAEAMVSNIKADLFVLPELCFTGYTFRSRDEAISLSEPAHDGASIIRMRALAAKSHAAIVFGFPERAEAGVYDSSAFVAPDCEPVIYRKLHLFMNEKDHFLPGDKPMRVAEFGGSILGMMICFDWIFPEVARGLALLGSHIICHPANLVLPYCQAAIITRCLENRIFALTANRIGRETRGGFDNKFTGKSQIIGPQGQIFFRGSDDKEEVGVADINYRESENKAINARNNLWDDRRPEYYLK